MPGMPGAYVQIFRNGRPVNINSVRTRTLIQNITLIYQSYTGINYPLVINRWILINNVKKTETEKYILQFQKE